MFSLRRRCQGLAAVGIVLALRCGLTRHAAMSHSGVLTDYEASYNEGISRYDRGDYSGAIADFTKALELNAYFANATRGRDLAYYGEGLINYQYRDYPGARADFTKALEQSPHFAEAYRGRGFVRYNEKDAPGAISDFQNAARLEDSEAKEWLAKNGYQW